MTRRKRLLAACLLSIGLAGCRETASGPIHVSVIGGAPALPTSNAAPFDPPQAYLTEAAAQGLVRFDPAGQVEPGLAQSWIVSDDGLRYTFRLARTHWADGAPVTAEQVEARLKAMASRASRNPLKPLLGAIAEVEAMTENVLEIRLKAPRPNFLQLLAQPEMGIVRNGIGTGPYAVEKQPGGSLLLSLPDEDDEYGAAQPEQDVVLRGERAALAVARFRSGSADFVAGGTAGDLPIARAAALPGTALRFDPTLGLFGLRFLRNEGPLGDADVRQALSMSIDRGALIAALAVPDLAPRLSLLPAGIAEIRDPALPAWSADPLAVRQSRAASIIAALEEDEPLSLSVALPPGPGYQLAFAHLRRDWRRIGVTAEAVPMGSRADLALMDAVAPANLATWYLRHFTCDASAICSAEADTMLENARNAQFAVERQALLASADRALTELTPFISLGAPVRWSLVSPRLTGFQPNPFARHFVGGLVAARR